MKRAKSTVFTVVFALISLSGCYRLSHPPELDESVRVTITANDTRLVRSQSYLQQEVARALEDRLGWRVSPTGSAKLNLAISEEKIESSGSDSRNIPARWNIKLTGHAVFSSRHGHILSDFSGTGHASTLADEPAALQQAAANAANAIAAWLEREGANWEEGSR